MAGLIDLRRDNLLLHLWFKALIRPVFPSGGSRKLPQAVPQYYSVSLVQPFRALLADLAAGKYRSYQALIRAGPP